MFINNATHIADLIAKECSQNLPMKKELNIIESIGVVCLVLIFLTLSAIVGYAKEQTNNRIIIGRRRPPPEAIDLSTSPI